MTDLEMTKLCAEAMGYRELNDDFLYEDEEGSVRSYTPLVDDAQAVALVKRFRLELTCGRGDVWIASNRGTTDYVSGNSADLNQAIVECVAKMQASST